jgi:hypothetical protein
MEYLFTDRSTVHSIAVVLLIQLLATGCDVSFDEAMSDESDPPYQDLDGGQQWPQDTEDGGTDDGEGFDTPVLDSLEDTEIDTADNDAGDCLDIGWDSYQVVGNCPGLPSSGAVIQNESCAITVPDELGSVIGESGTVAAAYVTTEHCGGIAEIADFPSVELTCIVEEASCEVELSGGTSGW